MPLLVGSAKVDITPRTPQHLAGYAARDHVHEGVHDPLALRALYVRGSGGDGLLVSADLLWFHEDSIERILPALAAELGLAPQNVLLCGTHTHSAPAVSGEQADPEWLGMVEKQTLAAAALARGRLREATLKAGRADCAIGVNRRELRPGGEVVLGRDPDGPIDRELVLVALDTPAGQPLARVAGFACHGVVMSARNYLISGDWPGAAAAALEARLDPGVFLFLNGGCANVNPRIGPQESFGPVEELAAEFVESVRQACRSLAPAPDDDGVAGADLTVHLPRKLREVEDGRGRTRPLRLRGLRIGRLRIVGFPGEVFSETSMAVKRGSPHPLTLVNSYTAGGSGGYVPVAEAYETGGYEVRVSPYAEGAEAVLRAGFLELLGEL